MTRQNQQHSSKTRSNVNTMQAAAAALIVAYANPVRQQTARRIKKICLKQRQTPFS